jgi:hypothetical protein
VSQPLPQQTGPQQPEAKTVLSDGSGYQIPGPPRDGATVMPASSSEASGGGRTLRVVLVALLTLLLLGVAVGVYTWLHKRGDGKLDPTDPKSLAQTVDGLANDPQGAAGKSGKSSSKIISWHVESSPSGSRGLPAEQRRAARQDAVPGRAAGAAWRESSWSCGWPATSAEAHPARKAMENQEPPVVKLEPVKTEPSRQGQIRQDQDQEPSSRQEVS